MSKEENVKFLLTQKKFHDFCQLPNFLLSSFGLDYTREYRSKRSMICRKCYFSLVAVSQLYILTFITKATYDMIMSDGYELSLLLRLISGLIYAFFGTVKCMAFLWNMKKYRKIFEILKEIYPKTRKERINYRVQNYFWSKGTLTVIYFYLGAVAAIATSPLMEGIILFIVDGFKVGWQRAEFGYYKLYEIEYSFDHQGLFSYLVTCSIELMHVHLVGVFHICGDIWLLCFIFQLCMHFDHIVRSLESYEPDAKELAKDQKFIAQFVKSHQIILNLGADLNQGFGLLLFLQLMSIGATLCCAGIYTLTQDLGGEFIEYLAFLNISVGQYFLICYYGQFLITKSQNVAEAAYNNSWYNASKSYKKSIFIILMRSQKEVEVNAIGLQPICLEAFKMVMGATYRVFALLKETML